MKNKVKKLQYHIFELNEHGELSISVTSTPFMGIWLYEKEVAALKRFLNEPTTNKG